MSDDELGRELKALLPCQPHARAIATGKCPCGSGLYGYKLFNTRKQYLLYCCHRCEKPRRLAVEKGGETLTDLG